MTSRDDTEDIRLAALQRLAAERMAQLATDDRVADATATESWLLSRLWRWLRGLAAG